MIKLKDVSFTYDSGETINNLNHINLTIQDGETVLLCGESGCGKTTLTRLINGLIPHYYGGKLTGQVLLDGKELRDYQLYQIGQRVGSVFQNPKTQFYNVDTTSEIVFGCENMALPVPEMWERLEKTTHSLKLEKLLNRSLFALSGGEKQKIACASADTIRPDIFVLDEPSSNLDISTIEDLIGVIRHWQSERKTVIIAEHRLYYLVPYADRILYMKHGSIAREFTREEIQKLAPEILQEMGLRSLDPFHLYPEATPKTASQHMRIKGFRFSYEKHGPLIVDIPDLFLPQGEIIGIIGNNGAGKSTFARCLCGLDKKVMGIFEINGVSYNAKQRRHISYMVMQDVNHQLFTEDVLDELLLSMEDEVEKADSGCANEILSSLDLLNKANLHPMSLSGGEKQRVAIGSAIASNKKIMIFDEPTSGLDYRHMLEVSDNLNHLKDMGKSLFLITHDPELIYKCCTYLLFIQGSKVLWHRPMDDEAVKLLRAFFSHEKELSTVNVSL
ncbi:MAG: energy-coupling factor ABC transporter ATP-binding protein [Eubacteriales bacterium]|nr:energy-coupling factor ABC transporter ATP-binding protein [Eubacteriales bacterium]